MSGAGDHVVHYFVVGGYIDDEGTVQLNISLDMIDAFPNGPLWDDNTGTWRRLSTREEHDTDQTILDALRDRLPSPNAKGYR